MNNIVKTIGVVALAGTVGLAAVAPAAAAPRHFRPWMGHQHYYGHYYRPAPAPWPGYYPNYAYGYGGYDPGYGIASGIIGGIFGTLAGAALTGGVVGGSHFWRCEHTYRSYVRATDSYTGYDGQTHLCRL